MQGCLWSRLVAVIVSVRDVSGHKLVGTNMVRLRGVARACLRVRAAVPVGVWCPVQLEIWKGGSPCKHARNHGSTRGNAPVQVRWTVGQLESAPVLRGPQ